MLTMTWGVRRLTTPTTAQLPRVQPSATFSGRPCRASWRRGVVARAVQGETATDLTDLKAALDRAVQAEDYREAAKLRDLIRELELTDPIAATRAQLEEAVRKEQYQEAARLRDRLAELLPPPPQFELPPTVSDMVTNGIRVSVRSTYVPAQSFPGGSQYLFAYNIKITNESQATVLLKSRYWLITDGNLETQEVRGPGVVGEQPVLGPGQSFEYQSACPLRTPVGSMEGYYEFWTRSGAGDATWGQPFKVAIGRFGLSTDAKF